MDGLEMRSLLSIFKGKRVFVTGDTGFKGSWLCLWLKELGADVVGYALPPQRENDHFNLIHLDKIIHHVTGDIRDLSSLQRVVHEFQPEFLFHLAAQAIVRISYEQPKMTFDTNIGGSVNVLEVCRTTPSIRSVVYITSDKCYKNKEWYWGYRENDEMGGPDPYSASKGAAELIFSAYKSSFFSDRADFGAVSVRAGNVIGGGDWSPDRIVPDCIKALQSSMPITIRNPRSTRPWQYVLEPLSGYLLSAADLRSRPKVISGSFNFGPDGKAIKTVKELAEKIISVWGSGSIELIEQKDMPHEANLLHLNCDKAFHLLKWRQRWNFDRTIEETVKWYKDVIVSGKNAIDVSKRQIASYMEG